MTKEKTTTKKSNFVPLTLRLPPEVHTAVKEAAEQSGRSLNEQVIHALTQFHGVTSQLERRLADLEFKAASYDALLAIVYRAVEHEDSPEAEAFRKRFTTPPAAPTPHNAVE